MAGFFARPGDVGSEYGPFRMLQMEQGTVGRKGFLLIDVYSYPCDFTFIDSPGQVGFDRYPSAAGIDQE